MKLDLESLLEKIKADKVKPEKNHTPLLSKEPESIVTQGTTVFVPSNQLIASSGPPLTLQLSSPYKPPAGYTPVGNWGEKIQDMMLSPVPQTGGGVFIMDFSGYFPVRPCKVLFLDFDDGDWVQYSQKGTVGMMKNPMDWICIDSGDFIRAEFQIIPTRTTVPRVRMVNK